MAPRSLRKRSRWLRTQSAVSGSSEAVGSSSSRTCGELISAFASATRVFCPAESLPVGRSRNSVRSSSSASVAMRPFEILDRVEPPEDLEVLPHRQPMRHVDIGALEIHLVQHLVALARHRGPEHLDRPGGGRHQAHDHGDGGGLPGAVAAQKPGDGAGLERKRDAVDRAGGLVDLHQLVDGNGGLGGCRHVCTVCEAAHVARAVARGKGQWSALHLSAARP